MLAIYFEGFACGKNNFCFSAGFSEKQVDIFILEQAHCSFALLWTLVRVAMLGLTDSENDGLSCLFMFLLSPAKKPFFLRRPIFHPWSPWTQGCPLPPNASDLLVGNDFHKLYNIRLVSKQQGSHHSNSFIYERSGRISCSYWPCLMYYLQRCSSSIQCLTPKSAKWECPLWSPKKLLRVFGGWTCLRAEMSFQA